jgi:hypothetical protein
MLLVVYLTLANLLPFSDADAEHIPFRASSVKIKIPRRKRTGYHQVGIVQKIPLPPFSKGGDLHGTAAETAGYLKE